MATKAASGFKKPTPAGDGQLEFLVPKTAKDGGGRGRIPAEKYLGRCTGVVAEKSKAGNNMWTWTFVITKGDYAGRDFKLWTVLTDDAAWKVVETLEALGVEIQLGQKIKVNKKEVIGVGCQLHVVDDTGQNGDGEWSKLKKISAHPKGAGFRPDGQDTGGSVDDDDETGGGEGGGEEPEPPKSTAKKKLGKGR